MRCVLFNGPPNVGKDEATKMMVAMYDRCFALKLAKPVKEGTHASLAIKLPWDAFESRKDVPLDSFFGKTPRQAYIAHSEQYMKVVYGQDIFGRLLVRELEHIGQTARYPHRTLVVVSDCGFTQEVLAVVEHLGPHNVAVVRLYRKGCDFKNDSRNYIVLPDLPATMKEQMKGVRFVDMYNNGTLEELQKKLTIELAPFVQPKRARDAVSE